MERFLSDNFASGERLLRRQIPQEGIRNSMIFIMGTTGSGKSTLAYILSGNLSRLEAYNENDVPLIRDDENLISHGCESRTFISNYFAHPTKQYVFWDCPGFEDNRGDTQDIASMYFLQRLFTLTEYGKVLLTVEHANVSVGTRNNAFDQLLSHVIHIFKNMDDWVNSIGIVVTKVPNFDQMSAKMLTDEDIMNQLTQFFEGYLTDKRARVNQQNQTDNSSLDDRICLVEKVLGHGRLSFIRLPTNEGRLDIDMNIKACMQNVQTIISQKLLRKRPLPSDIRITVGRETIIAIRDIHIPYLNNQAVSYVSDYVKLLEQQLKKLGVYDLKDISRSLSRISNVSKNIKSVINRKPGAGEDFSERLKNLQNLSNVDMQAFEFENLDDLDRQMIFLKDIINRGSISHHKNWIPPLSTFLKQNERLRVFYDFFKSVPEKIDRCNMFKTAIQCYQTRNIGPQNVLNFLKDKNIIEIPEEVYELWETDDFDEPKQLLAETVRDAVVRKMLYDAAAVAATVAVGSIKLTSKVATPGVVKNLKK